MTLAVTWASFVAVSFCVSFSCQQLRLVMLLTDSFMKCLFTDQLAPVFDQAEVLAYGLALNLA